MSRICYVNGQYVYSADAQVSMWDRGYQLSDGVYEVIIFFNRHFLDEEKHLDRLKRSLDILKIRHPMSDAALKLVMRELMRRNPYDNGSLYVQVTRGTAKRGHPFPNPEVPPSVTMALFPAKQPSLKDVTQGVKVITVPDIRWHHCDVKVIALLPNLLANQQAMEAGAKEVFMYRADGIVTEGSLSNSYIVTHDGVLVTHAADDFILNGVRRQNVMRLAKEAGIPVDESGFTVAEAKAACEAFLTSANTNILPVTQIDDAVVNGGAIGEVTQKLSDLYRVHVTEQTGKTWE